MYNVYCHYEVLGFEFDSGASYYDGEMYGNPPFGTENPVIQSGQNASYFQDLAFIQTLVVGAFVPLSGALGWVVGCPGSWIEEFTQPSVSQPGYFIDWNGPLSPSSLSSTPLQQNTSNYGILNSLPALGYTQTEIDRYANNMCLIVGGNAPYMLNGMANPNTEGNTRLNPLKGCGGNGGKGGDGWIYFDY